MPTRTAEDLEDKMDLSDSSELRTESAMYTDEEQSSSHKLRQKKHCRRKKLSAKTSGESNVILTADERASGYLVLGGYMFREGLPTYALFPHQGIFNLL